MLSKSECWWNQVTRLFMENLLFFSRVSQYISTILNRLLAFLTSTVLHRYRKSRLSRLPKGDIKQVHLKFSMRCSWPKVMRGVFLGRESPVTSDFMSRSILVYPWNDLYKLTTIFLNRLKSTTIDVIYPPFRCPKDITGYHFPCCLVVS